MPTFEFETAGRVFEIDAENVQAAAAKFQALKIPTGPTPTHWGSAAAVDPAPGHQPGPLGDLSKEAAMRGVVGSPETVQPAVAPPAVSGQPAAATPVPTPPQAPPSGPDKPMLGAAGVKEEIAKQHPLALALAGFGSPIPMGYQSAKQLVGMDVDPADIEGQRAITSTTPGMIGNIAGNVAMTALPMGAAVNAIRTGLAPAIAAGGKVGTLARIAAGGAVPAVAGAEAGLTTPVLGDESRLANSLFGAAAGKAFEFGGRAMSQLIRPSQEAQELMAKGIQPTINQGGEGLIGRLVAQAENIGANIPLIGQWVRQGSQRTLAEAGDLMGGRAQIPALPHSAPRPGRGDFALDMQAQHDVIKDQVLKGKAVTITQAFRDGMTSAGTKELKAVSPEITSAFQKDMESIISRNGRVGLKGLEDVDTILAERIAKYADRATHEDRVRHAAYEAAREQVSKLRNTRLTFDERMAYEDLKDREAHGKILTKALDYAKQGSRETPAKLLVDAVEAMTPTPEKIAKTGLFQDITEPLKKVLDQDKTRDALVRRAAYTVAGLGTGAVGYLNPMALAGLAATYGLGKIASTAPGAKAMMGGYEWQKSLAEALRRRLPTGTMTTVGGTEGQREE